MTTRLAITILALLASSRGNTSEARPGPTPAGRCKAAHPAPPERLTLELVAEGFLAPVGLEHAPDDARLFVIEQRGEVFVIEGGRRGARPWLDLKDRVACCGERGLLGLAFAPDFARSRRVFVHYSDKKGDTRVSELRAGDTGVDPRSERVLFTHPQPYANHNGGQLAFGPDGRLYLGLGDGGAANDPHGHGQDLGTALGKLLRFDASVPGQLRAAPDNPFLDRTGARREIWSYGLRNPWRFSFDRETGDLYIADVGQNRWEEVHVAPARTGRGKGANFGWSVFEGSHCFGKRGRCEATRGAVPPVLEYPHPQGCSITGGHVYRGKRLPALRGAYFYGDYCTAFVRSFRLEDDRACDARDWTDRLVLPKGRRLDAISAFGVDADGEIYVVDHQGEIYRIAPGT